MRRHSIRSRFSGDGHRCSWRPDLAYWLVDRYIEASGDTALRKLLRFYASYRAFVRGKVQSFRLEQAVEDAPDPPVSAAAGSALPSTRLDVRTGS